jgi:hypothetical protein
MQRPLTNLDYILIVGRAAALSPGGTAIFGAT